MKRVTLALITLSLAILAIGCPLHVTHYRDSDGSLVYVGDYQNDGDLALVNADIQATAYDAAGNVIATASHSMCQILPGKGILPFEVAFPPGTSDPASVDFKVVGTPTAEPYLATGLQAHVTAQTTDLFGNTWVSGEVANTSPNHYYTGYVCASWTDSAGNVLRTTWASTALIDFPPGESMPFALWMANLPPEAVNINLYLDAGWYPPGYPIPTVVTLPQNSFEDTLLASTSGKLGPMGLGMLHNTLSVPISAPRISATYRDSQGNLLGAGQALDFCQGDIVPPGGYTFGGFMMAGLSGSPTLEIQAYDKTGTEFYRFTASNVQAQGSAFTGKLTGKIKNTSGKALNHLRVCGGVFDDDGFLISANTELLDVPAGGFAPGASLSFTLSFPAMLGVASRGEAFVVGAP